MYRFRPAHKVRAYRPCLEILEARNLLSTYMVDRLTDTGTGSGLAGDLSYCIDHAADGDTINFGVTGTINLGFNSLPALTHSIDIEGPGAAQLTVTGGATGGGSIFWVGSGATVSISGLSITNGHSFSSAPGGGGIYNAGTLTVSNCTLSGNSANSGGGIYNDGTLTVSNCTLSDNSATHLESLDGYGGGGILNDGTLTVSNSTLSGNYASPSGGVTVGGGGIANFGALTLSNSTVAGNRAQVYEGGGIATDGTSPVTLTNVTLTANRTIYGSGGGLYVYSGSPVLHNTLIAGNFQGEIGTSPADVHGSFTDIGHNLIGGNPLLGPLQDNGGSTQTMALLAGSPALNAGDSDFLGTADQRGVVRSGGVNIGAYQASATAFALTAPATATAGTPFDATLKAVDPFGQTALGYTGRVTFTSADPYGATLPADYTFAAADHGVHLFPGAATLYTAGTWDVTATDTSTGSITGSASASVNPAAADHVLFVQQPTDTAAGQTFSPVMVEVVDAFGNVETGDDSDTITLSIGANPGGGTLGGTLTVTVSGGIATFSDLAIDVVGDGYTLHAMATGLTDADSAAFRIT
jgi:hypothetical protein